MKRMFRLLAALTLLFSVTLAKVLVVDAASSEVTFYIVRHGKTMLNTTDRVQGWADAPLTQAGADVVAQAAYGLKDIQFDKAVSSDSGRAVETANLILAGNEQTKPGLETDWRLREFNFGHYEGEENPVMWNDIAAADGKTMDEWMATMTPESFANGVAALDAEYLAANPGVNNWPAEDYATIAARLKASMDEIAESQSQNGGGNVLIVSHGLSIGALLKDIDPDAALPPAGLKNASVSKVTYKDGQYTIETINDLSYIQAGQAAGITAPVQASVSPVTPVDSANEVVIYIVRHGKTMLNTTDRVQGWADAPLTPAGEQVVDYTAAGLRDVDFVSAYSSDSGRAVETAEHILAGNRNTVPTLQTDWRLREFNFGTYEGDLNHTMWSDIAAADGKTLDEWMTTMTPESFADGVAALDATRLAPGGEYAGMQNWPAENYATIQNRLTASLNTIANEAALNGGGNVLVVSHGLSIGALLAEIAPDVQLPAGGLKNASVTKVVFKNGEYTVEAVNDTSYTNEGEKMQSQFALTYDLNGGTSTTPDAESVYYASLATKVSDPVRAGFTFKGWNTAKDGSGTAWNFDTTTMPFEAVTLYAQWQANASEPTDTGTNTDPTTLPTTGMPILETGLLGLLFVGAGILLIRQKR